MNRYDQSYPRQKVRYNSRSLSPKFGVRRFAGFRDVWLAALRNGVQCLWSGNPGLRLSTSLRSVEAYSGLLLRDPETGSVFGYYLRFFMTLSKQLRALDPVSGSRRVSWPRGTCRLSGHVPVCLILTTLGLCHDYIYLTGNAVITLFWASVTTRRAYAFSPLIAVPRGSLKRYW